MDVYLLEDIGLTKNQAAVYIALVEKGKSTAPAIASELGEGRTNIYKVLDKLCAMGLATKDASGAKVVYSSISPAALEQIVESHIAEAESHRRKLRAAMPDLINFYFKHSEQPSIRYYHGQPGLERIYKAQAATGKPIYFIRTIDDLRFLGFDTLHKLRNIFPRLGIVRHTIIQDVPLDAPKGTPIVPVAESDREMLLDRTWIRADDYTSPVEWAVYGNKLAIVSYGQEAIGMIIESQQIADAFLQIYKLLDKGIKSRPDYSEFPRYATHTAKPKVSRQR